MSQPSAPPQQELDLAYRQTDPAIMLLLRVIMQVGSTAIAKRTLSFGEEPRIGPNEEFYATDVKQPLSLVTWLDGRPYVMVYRGFDWRCALRRFLDEAPLDLSELIKLGLAQELHDASDTVRVSLRAGAEMQVFALSRTFHFSYDD